MLPEPMQLTERQACDFLRQISCPLHVMLGRQGLFAGPEFDKRKKRCPGPAVCTGMMVGTIFISKRQVTA
ncbi:hypothetical protein NWF32_27930 [Pseudomonas qingdaonensis]|nr:hypothetical protein [Pseudomonas qingdaonensis]